jgi:hypothetical protein
MEQPEMLVNDEHTRSFWTLPVRKTSTTTPPWSTLLRLVQQVNDVLRKIQQPTYYESPIFHVSLASCAGNVVLGENKMMPNDVDDDEQQKQHRSTATTTTTSSINKKDGISNTVQHNVSTDVRQIVTTTGKEQIELSDDSDAEKNDDDDNETPRFLRAHIDSIHCTFGTTKSYVIPLMKSS